MRAAVSLALVAATGCRASDSGPPPEIYHYAVGELHVPRTGTESRENALDLDGDKAIDNQLGGVLAFLNSYGFDVTGSATEALVRGNAIMLIELETTSFRAAADAAVVTYLGANPDPEPCTEPTDVATCGRHLAALAHYDVRDGSASDTAVGDFKSSTLLASGGVLPVELALDPAIPLHLELHAARIKLTEMSEAGGSAVLAGGLTRTAVDTVVIPEAARQMTRILTRDCAPPCTCSTEAAQLLQYFDDDADCAIDADELRASDAVRGLVASDIYADGEPLLSFSLPVELVPAIFEP